MRHLLSTAVAAAALLPAVALADVGPTARIWEMVQEGQGVDLTLAIPDDGYLLVSDPHTLTRERDGREVTLFAGRVLAESTEDAAWYTHVCVSYSSETDCGETPEDCFDCDGDGAPECPLDAYCDYYALFDYLDDCVPAGEATYTIASDVQEYSSGSDTIAVEDTGESCGGGDGCAIAPFRPESRSFLALVLGF